MNLTIDDKPVEAHEGESVLQVALRHGIPIPHLCTHPNLPPFGACRLCLVEIDGMRGYPASCSTPAAEGMTIRTETEALRELRRSILQLILLEHPSACLVCDKQELCERYRPTAQKAGRTTGCHTCNNKEVCEVKDLAHEFGIEDLPVAPAYRDRPIERTDPFIDRDLNLCILCGRCVRICKAHQGNSVIDFVGRGSDTRIGEAFGRSLAGAGCTFCGSCVDVCPTGSLADRYAKWQGRADAETETSCTLCPAGCALRVRTRRGKLIGAHGADGATPLCVLGRFGLPELHNGGSRLRAPHVLVGERLREVDWPTALGRAAELLEPHRGETFAVVFDASATLEDRVMLERFCREIMGSPHCIEAKANGHGAARATLPSGVRTALLTGNFLDAEALDALDVLIVQDIYPSAATERAQVVLPAAGFGEVGGTWRDGAGRARRLNAAGRAPGQALADWAIAAALASTMEGNGFDHGSAPDVAPENGSIANAPPVETPPAALDVRRRATHWRGHELANHIRGLQSLPAESAATPTPARG